MIETIADSGKDADYAFTQLYERYEKHLYRFCLALTADRDFANDIFQETFVNFMNNLDPAKQNINVRSYLMKTAKNIYLNHRRKDIFMQDIEIPELIDDDNSDEEEIYNLILRAIDMLEEKYRIPFILREFEDISYKEIGEIIGLSWSGAQSRVLRAKEKILKIIQPYINDPNDPEDKHGLF